MPTAVPSAEFTERGFIAPTEAEILTGVQTDIDVALGGGVNPGLSTPQGQIASTETAIIGEKNAQFIYFTNQVDPALNSGRYQDAIGRVYYMSRIAGAPTVVQVTCSGLDGVVIPIGALARAQDGNLYFCQQQGTIASGSVVLPFACTVYGPIQCPADSDGWTIYQTIFGWDGVSTEDAGVLGRNVETRSEFEARRAASVALNAVGILDSILSEVLAVDGVLDAFVTENNEADPRIIGGKIVGPNSIYAAVLGGDSQDVGEAIWRHKAPGAGYTGNTAVTVVDPSDEYLPPVPEYSVRFERPDLRDIAVLVALKSSQSVPGDAADLVQGAVLAAFAGTDGGPRAKIGSTIYASRLYAGIAALGSWVLIVSIQVGLEGAGATFTGAINGATLTVSAIAAGSIAVGQLIQDDTSTVDAGTTITEFFTGIGGVGTYRISNSNQIVASQLMRATDMVDRVTMNIDEAPVTAANNIDLTLV